MLGQKLTIVPVTLHTENKDVQPSVTQISSNSCVFTIRTAKAEISFFHGIDERIVETVMRELKNL